MIAATAVDLHPKLHDWPLTRPVADLLVPILNDLSERNAQVVTLDDLASYGTGKPPAETARVLRRAGWLHPLRTRGAWWFAACWPQQHTAEFLELRARLRVCPDTPACVGGRSVAQIRHWLRRPTQATIGMPPRVKVPQCLDRYYVYRWAHRIPTDEIHGLPVWKPETLLAYMGARPARFPWSDIKEWLWEACELLNLDLLSAELEGRPRGAWMKTAYLIDMGERPTLAEALAATAPTQGRGPYLIGDPKAWRSSLVKVPFWAPQFEVLDYALPPRWYDKWR